jgi:hypothetical protein
LTRIRTRTVALDSIQLGSGPDLVLPYTVSWGAGVLRTSTNILGV